MRTSKIFTLVLLTVTAFIFSQCEVYREGCTDPAANNYEVAADIDDGSCEYSIDPQKITCDEDFEGNLSVTNQTDEVLLLYLKSNGLSEQITCIPAGTDDFVINIPNQSSLVYTLQVWKASDVVNPDSPDIGLVYRQWSVALSSNTLASERANWIITDSDVNKSSGTLSLSYPSIDEYNQQVIYQVDIYLNSKTGTRLASMQPGVSDKKVSVDYGVHYLYFRYWYSDPNSSSGEITEIGWDEISDVVINAEHQTATIGIPVFYSIVGKYGELTVNNSTEGAISIWANDQLIEKIAKVDGSADGLSIIPANDATTFLIPEETYTITAKSIDGTTTIASFKAVNVVSNETAELSVGVKQKEVSIKNNTSEKILVFTEDGNTYLGKSIEVGSSSGLFLVDATIDSLLVVSPDKTQKKKIAATTDVSVTTLEDYITESLSITSSWTVLGGNYYQSPDINHTESTTMTATLVNTSTVLLSFEYKVSSEYDYDKFSFKIDGNYELSNESGETDWKNFSVNILPGTHTLEWIYQKDDMFDVGSDNVEIRNISIN